MGTMEATVAVLPVVLFLVFLCYRWYCKEFKVGSWNVDSFMDKSAEGKMQAIREHLELHQILALQETEMPLNFGNEADGSFFWRFDRELVTGNSRGGGILVYLSEKLVKEQLAGIRQLPNVPPDVIVDKKKSNNQRTKPFTGIQYMHFHVKQPIQFDLVVIYNATGHRDSLVTLFEYFLQDLETRNVLFIGDLNINHQINEDLGDRLRAIDNSLVFLVEEPTRNAGSQTDHIIPCFDPLNLSAKKEPVSNKCEISDHYLIGCTLIEKQNNPQPQNRSIVQPIWGRNTEGQGIKNWVEMKVKKGPCVIVFYIEVLEFSDVNSLLKHRINIYLRQEEGEKNLIICVGKADKAEQVKPLITGMSEAVNCIDSTGHVIISRRCTLIHVEKNERTDKLLGRVLNRGNGNQIELSRNFEFCASRYHMCNDPDSQCSQFFATEADLLKHAEETHKSETKIKCSSCKQQSSSDLLDKLHRKLVHGKQLLMCNFPDCKIPVTEKTKRTHALLVHLQNICDDKRCKGFNSQHPKKDHNCAACGDSPKFYDSQKKLGKSCVAYHRKPHAKQVTCLKCKKACKRRKSFSQHLESCYGGKLLRCEACGTKYQHQSWYREHEKHCRGAAPYQCDICGKGYKYKKSFETHISSCGGSKPHKCENCGKEYIYKKPYETHISWCGGSMSYQCETCGRGYSNEKSYETHISWCGGDKPYKCKTCDQGYSNKKSYETHISWCGGDKPYKCRTCDQGYSNKKSYTDHISWCRR